MGCSWNLEKYSLIDSRTMVMFYFNFAEIKTANEVWKKNISLSIISPRQFFRFG
jgi:hypothetical protein